MKTVNFFTVYVVFLILTIGCYVGNIVRLVKCDFEPSYKAEMLYGIGLVSPTFYVTAFINIEDGVLDELESRKEVIDDQQESS